MKKDWLVYRVVYRNKLLWYIKVLSNSYAGRLKLAGERTIIKDNLNYEEALNFTMMLNKLKK